ncbi:putative efflux protein, MATE family [Desulfonauticus submarinus]|uniref:Multidrug-efflux transporter n=1 Tax=Desulfonauticus submarinus TaxID=206665 RepID=A0A1H0C0T9_9BACT|nr:MATE family efflux transporter [Desulfonauticus submarinus]SDN51511.1 putative efflux protein, MATE family [Desulfonauticus submarinus]
MKNKNFMSFFHIWRLSWPQVLMMVFHFGIGFVDVLVAGRLGKDVQACMGLTTQAMFFFLVVASAVANGSVAAISQSLGAGLEKRAKRFIGLGFQIGIIAGVIIVVFGNIFLDNLLTLLHLPTKIYPIGRYLLKVYLLIIPAYYLLLITNAFFRAQQKVIIPLFATMLVTLVNTIGDFGLGLGLWGLPSLGYKGLAWSTFASILTGFLFNFVILMKQKLLVRESFAPWRWIKKAFFYLYKVAWPAGLMQIVWHSAYLALYAIVAALPFNNVVALAGMSAGIRIESFLFLPAFAFNFTASILVGHFLGAGDIIKAKRVGYQVLGFGFILVSILTLILFFFLKPITYFIAPDPSVAIEAMNYLKFNMSAIIFLVPAMVLGGALTGAGATFYQLTVIFISTWLTRIPLAYFLGHIIFKTATGVWLAMFLSMGIQAGLTFYVYQFKNWDKFALRKKKIICTEEL